MTAIRIDAHPVLSVADEVALAEFAALQFSCPDGPQPGSNQIGLNRYVLGQGSEWSSLSHSLKVEVKFKEPAKLGRLWESAPIVGRDSEVVAALEWKSQKTSRRGLSAPVAISRSTLGSIKTLDFELYFGPRELLGNVILAVRLYVGRPAKLSKTELHLANVPGFRLGTISPEWELVLDGDGSLFPITHSKAGPNEPLWRFWGDWEDPTYDEFSTDFVSLAINEDHPAFKDLIGDPKAPYSTFLFRQVLATWLLLFFQELQRKTENEPVDSTAESASLLKQWDAIVDGHRELLLPGSIGRAASELKSKGDLDVSSPETLLRTAQIWIDRTFNAK